MTTPKQRPERRFGIRALIILMAVVSVPLAWKFNRVRAQRRAIEAIESAGGYVVYDFELRGLRSPPVPQWFRILVGDAFFGSVVRVHLPYQRVENPHATQADALAGLKHLPAVRTVAVQGASDAGLAHLAHAPAVAKLWIEGSFTDAGVAQLAVLQGLEDLHLASTDLTDTSLGHLRQCRALKRLSIAGSSVSELGEAHFRQALPHCSIAEPSCSWGN